MNPKQHHVSSRIAGRAPPRPDPQNKNTQVFFDDLRKGTPCAFSRNIVFRRFLEGHPCVFLAPFLPARRPERHVDPSTTRSNSRSSFHADITRPASSSRALIGLARRHDLQLLTVQISLASRYDLHLLTSQVSLAGRHDFGPSRSVWLVGTTSNF